MDSSNETGEVTKWMTRGCDELNMFQDGYCTTNQIYIYIKYGFISYNNNISRDMLTNISMLTNQ
jgi:hypothetical protein